MRKLLYITFLWLAGGIVLAHSIVPHVHHMQGEREEVCETDESESVVGFLASIFHFNTGDLEHFQVQKTSPEVVQLYAILAPSPVLDIPVLEYHAISYHEEPQLCTTEVWTRIRALRGPPRI